MTCKLLKLGKQSGNVAVLSGWSVWAVAVPVLALVADDVLG